ncbi:threonylcarbamoyl-AMP synthase [Rhodocaloribacter litoris]|uniref:L-threonylcarbamoyladenylate synthase n=1 Tax=Rhodocaloribacter litoris TaxID=2558931 RepID=UPI001422A0CD|nr:L-threonylcarbamoyladenylate synthase [Rhodocaloribacter litoris]QXD15893.1 threonylcarbamoyl-AMP synthase [Rhodocaloribacter litoris]
METLLTTEPEEAAAFIRRGEVVAFPTETVYGLGADALREDAVRRIFEAKERPADNPLIVHVADRAMLRQVAASVPPMAETLIAHFFPGPLTLILPRAPAVPAVVSGGLPTVGVRMPRHPVAQAFLAACGVPVAAPSANRSGRPSPTTWEAVYADLAGRIPCILRGDRTEVGLESTVVDCTGPVPVVLRAGAVSLERLRAVLPQTRLAGDTAEVLARSPGTRYRHYAPRARVRLIDAPEEAMPAEDAAYIGLVPPPEPRAFGLVRVCADADAYAHALFDFFRRCEAAGLGTIYCQRVAPEGIGLALMDRLHRASRA